MVFARPKPDDLSEPRSTSGDELRALVEKSPQIGARLVESAAKYGMHSAQLTFARMLLHGHGVAVDHVAACRWFAVAAESGDPEAINMLGRCHEFGWGVPLNRKNAAAFYRQAARKNYASAQYNLGQLLLASEPSPAERREGLGWHLVAAKAGHAKSMNVIGRFCEEGWEMPKSVDNAIGWYRKAAEAGDYWGQFNLGRVLADDGDTEQALVWLARSIELGNDEFVAGVIPALKAHPDPAVQALGEAAARQSGKAAGPEGMDGTPEIRPRSRSRFSLGWLFGGPSGAPAR
jgi:TPR repeat protein